MSNIKVCVKLRPLSERDIKLEKEEQWKVADNKSNVQCVNIANRCEYRFDHTFGTKCLNYEVYMSVVKPIVDSCLSGFNGTILTYGSTSSGKNHTMLGNDADPGIILITLERLFKTSGLFQRTIRFGYIEIYKEKMYDLLKDRKQVLIDGKQGGKQGDISLTNDVIAVDNFEKAVEILLNASYKRKSAGVDDSKLSSLSHSIFQITIESENKTKGKLLVSHLRFVHVAGCEPETMDPLSVENESNKSLRQFNAVVDELNRGESNVNFNNSVLTMLLRESLVGNSNTAIICNVRTDEVEETISRLKCVRQAKNVRTFPMRNEMRNIRSTRCTTSVDEQLTHEDKQQLKEIADLRVENLLLRKALEDVKASFATKTIWFEEQLKNAEFAQQTLTHLRTEDKKSFERIQSDLKLQIEKLTKSNEYLTGKLKPRHRDTTDHSLRKLSESLPSPSSSSDKSNVRDIKRKIECLVNEWGKNGKERKYESHRKRDDAKRTTDRDRTLSSDKTESHTTTVPDSHIGRVIGVGGAKLKTVASATGARVSISERKGDSDRILTINGSKSSVARAMDMIQQMLSCDD